MSRILLVDDSPHAQRMGERILADDGFEVVTVSNAESALVRLDDVDPDVVIADTVMPGRTGFDICQYVKLNPRHRHVRVILTAGVLETMDEAQLDRAAADSILRKPFEASALVGAVRPLAERAAQERAQSAGDREAGATTRPAATPVAPFIALVDAEQVHAAVTVALDAAMGGMVEEIAQRVLAALKAANTAARPAPALAAAASPADVPPPPAPMPAGAPAAAAGEPVRRASPLRLRTGSILGIEINRPEPPAGTPDRD